MTKSKIIGEIFSQTFDRVHHKTVITKITNFSAIVVTTGTGSINDASVNNCFFGQKYFLECPDLYDHDCVDGDCCATSWLNDGVCDGEDQLWGCNLICYSNDGGDCGPIPTFGED